MQSTAESKNSGHPNSYEPSHFSPFSPFLAMRSVTYWLLVNLSVSDLLITCLCGPVHVIHSIVMGFWPFGAFVCYAYSYFQGMTVLVSSYTLVVISFER